jgi:hypothetical protein
MKACGFEWLQKSLHVPMNMVFCNAKVLCICADSISLLNNHFKTWMRNRENKSTLGFQDSTHFRYRLFIIFDILQGHEAGHYIKMILGEFLQTSCTSQTVMYVQSISCFFCHCQIYQSLREIYSSDNRTFSGQFASVVSFTASQVQNNLSSNVSQQRKESRVVKLISVIVLTLPHKVGPGFCSGVPLNGYSVFFGQSLSTLYFIVENGLRPHYFSLKRGAFSNSLSKFCVSRFESLQTLLAFKNGNLISASFISCSSSQRTLMLLARLCLSTASTHVPRSRGVSTDPTAVKGPTSLPDSSLKKKTTESSPISFATPGSDEHAKRLAPRQSCSEELLHCKT